jgi:hypothetical protein
MKARSILFLAGAVALAFMTWWIFSPSGNRQHTDNSTVHHDPSIAAPNQSPAAQPQLQEASPQAEPKLEIREQINHYLKLLAGVELPSTAHTFTKGNFTIPVEDMNLFLRQLDAGLDKDNKKKWTRCSVLERSGTEIQRAHDELWFTKWSLSYRMVPVRPGVGMPQPSYGLTVDPSTGAAYFAMTPEYDE